MNIDCSVSRCRRSDVFSNGCCCCSSACCKRKCVALALDQCSGKNGFLRCAWCKMIVIKNDTRGHDDTKWYLQSPTEFWLRTSTFMKVFFLTAVGRTCFYSEAPEALTCISLLVTRQEAFISNLPQCNLIYTSNSHMHFYKQPHLVND